MRQESPKSVKKNDQIIPGFGSEEKRSSRQSFLFCQTERTNIIEVGDENDEGGERVDFLVGIASFFFSGTWRNFFDSQKILGDRFGGPEY